MHRKGLVIKRLLFIVLIFLSRWGWAGPTITPSTATAIVGNTVQFASTDTVTWSLVSGSTGTITAGGLYKAPISLPANNIIAGCPALPNDHIYNTRIDNLPVDTNSAGRINNVAANKLTFEVSFPANVMSDATPTTVMKFFYTTQRDGQSFPTIPYPYAGVENAATPTNYFAQDRHQLGVSTTTCKYTEIYNLYPVGTGSGNGCPTCTAQSGVQYDGMSYALADANSGGGTTDAAGLYIEPLAIRYSELKAGVIKHALRFTLANGYIYSGIAWPATTFTNQCVTFGTCFPYGSRLRLKASFSTSGYSPAAKTILTALKNYGMFLSDGGTTLAIQTASDVTNDTATWNTVLNEIPNISTISKSDFEQVDESSLMVSTASGKVNLANPYVVPTSFAEVIATKNSDSSSSTVRVGIQPVTVGTKNLPFQANSGSLSVMSGTPQFQIPFWIEGATTTTVTCSMSPTIGTLTSGCLYTAPSANFNVLSTASVTMASTVDSTNSISFPLIIFSSDAIRMNIGGKAAFISSPVIPYDAAGNYGPDANGNYWWSDPIGNVTRLYSKDDDSFPQASWPATTDVGLFYTKRHGNSDAAWAAMVPNGNYTLNLGFATTSANGPPVSLSSATIDSQGVILLSTASLTQATFTPTTKSYTVNVSNNQFYFAIRQVVSSQFPFLNNWSLTPLPPVLPPGPSETIRGKVTLNGIMRLL